MRTGRLIVLALIVIVLGAFVYFYERHQPTTSEAEERANLVFPELETDDVRGLAIQNENGSYRFTKQGDTWRLTEPISYPAEASAVRNVLSSLDNLEIERRFSADETDPAAYGLDDAARRVVLESADGTTRTLTVGEEAALGSSRAVSVDGSEVLLVGTWFAANLDKDLDAWRSHDVVDIAASQVAGLELESASGTVDVARDEDQWRLLEPVDDLADREHVEDLISDLNALRVQEFLDERPGAAELGLEEPRYRVEIVRREAAEPVTLEFGATKTDAENRVLVCCRRNGVDTFWVDNRAEARLARPPHRWRSAVVWPFDTWDVQRLTLRSGDDGVTVSREEGAWRCGEQPADGSAVLDRLSALSELEASAFDLVRPEGEPSGTVALVVGEGEDASEVRLELFSEAINAGDAVVAVSARDTVMAVGADEVRELLSDPAALCEPPPPPNEPSPEDPDA